VSDPDRLKTVLQDDIGRLLLDSMEDDVPRAGAHARALLALGAGSAVSASGGAATAATLAKAKGVAAPLVVAKWVALGMSAGLLTMGTAAVVTHGFGATPEPAKTPLTAPRTSATSRAARSVATPAGTFVAPPPLVELLPSTAAMTAAGGHGPDSSLRAVTRAQPSSVVSAQMPTAASTLPMPGSNAAFPVPTSNLGLEVSSLDAARAALASGNAQGTLAALDLYARRFPRGALRPEANVLRAEALRAQARLRDQDPNPQPPSGE
jgi:hypothetical protein